MSGYAVIGLTPLRAMTTPKSTRAASERGERRAAGPRQPVEHVGRRRRRGSASAGGAERSGSVTAVMPAPTSHRRSSCRRRASCVVGAEHQPADRVAVGGARVDDADHLAVVQHGDPVGHVEQLVEVLGDQQHAGAAGAAFEQQLLGSSGGGDVEAAARVGGDDQPGVAGEGAHEHDPLDVAARQRRQRALAVDGAQPAGLVALAVAPADLAPVDARAACGPGRARRGRRAGAPSGRARPQSRTGSSGTPTAPAASALAGAGRARLPADRRRCPTSAARRPMATSYSSRWPLPATPATPTSSPARTSRSTSVEQHAAARVAQRHAAQRQRGHVAVVARRPLGRQGGDAPADHRLDQLGVGHVRRAGRCRRSACRRAAP